MNAWFAYKKMKRSWFSILVFAGLVALLVVLAALQYRWQTAASEADREKMQVRVDSDVHRFADDFNREMEIAFRTFQGDSAAADIAADSHFTESLAAWKENAQFPDLISEFYYFPAEQKDAPYKFDTASGKFIEVAASDDTTAFRDEIAKSDGRNFFEKHTALVIPRFKAAGPNRIFVTVNSSPGTPPSEPPAGPEKIGYLVLMLDRKVINEKILPQLTQKFFGDGDFRVAVTDSAGSVIYSDYQDAPFETAASDASADIMTIFPVNVFLTRVVRGEPTDAKKSTTVFAERLETKNVRRSWTISDNKEPDEVIKRGRADLAMAPAARDDSAWKVNVRHTAGSVNAFIRGERNKNLAISFGIYLLLIGGVLAIVLSAMRSKRLAQRQLDFVSSVSHEFRTPLAVIYSAGENLADGVAANGNQVEKYGTLIKNEGRKLSAMVEQILEFAGARSGQRKYNFAKSDVSELIGDAVAEVAPVIKENAVELRTDIPTDLPPVKADRAAFSQAVQNLILNAVKYGNGNKFVEISAAQKGDAVTVSVKDRGIGISKSDMRHLFEPFFRARSVVDAQIHGNGLGLSLVKQIVEAHGGTIRAESEKGVGSTFTISIPSADGRKFL